MSRDDAEKSRLRRCYVLLCLPTAWARSSQQRVAAFIAAAALFLVALGSLSRDAVPINHLDAARAYFDRRDVLYSRWAEAGFFWTATAAVPTYTAEQKAALSAWNSSAALRSCQAVLDTPLVWTLKTPKAASSTLQDLILALAALKPGRFVVNTRQLRPRDPRLSFGSEGEPERRAMMLRLYSEYFSSLRRRTVYTAHGWFIDLERHGKGHGSNGSPAAAAPAKLLHPEHHGFVAYRPVCIGTMRDPLKRLLSHYNYLHSGPRSLTTRLRHGPQAGDGAPSFEQCVRQAHMREPITLATSGGKNRKIQQQQQQPLSAAAAAALERKFKCLHWAGVQLKYFCGYADYETCEAAAQDALDIAIGNVDKHFLLVALVERFHESLEILERLLPVIFSGISDLYKDMGSSRVNTNNKARGHSSPPASYSPSSSAIATSRTLAVTAPQTSRAAATTGLPGNRSFSSLLSPAVHAFVSEKLRYEQALYDHVAGRFEKQVEACSARDRLPDVA